MLLTYSDAVKSYGSEYSLRKALSANELTKITRGLYSIDDNPSDLALIMAKYPNAIFTMDCAFYYHGLTDVVPEIWHLATRRNATRIKSSNIRQYFELASYFGIGKMDMVYDGAVIRVYDKERMLIELAKNRNKLPFDYYKEIVQSYRRIADDLDMGKLDDYLNIIGTKRDYYDILQREIF